MYAERHVYYHGMHAVQRLSFLNEQPQTKNQAGTSWLSRCNTSTAQMQAISDNGQCCVTDAAMTSMDQQEDSCKFFK